jgi:hypothetical protein
LAHKLRRSQNFTATNTAFNHFRLIFPSVLKRNTANSPKLDLLSK